MTTLLIVAAFALCVRLVTKGRSEQVWEPGLQKRARMIDDLVWGNTTWINHADGGHETPEEGIARLHKVLGRSR